MLRILRANSLRMAHPSKGGKVCKILEARRAVISLQELKEIQFSLTIKVVQWQRICVPVQEMQEMQVRSLDQEDPLGEEMATHCSILAWKIPWIEEPGGL